MNDDPGLLRRRIEELEELQRLAQSLGEAKAVDEILESILIASHRVCGARRAAIILFSPFSREVVQTLVRSTDPSGIGIDHNLNLLVAGWMEHHGKPLHADDVIAALQLTNPSDLWKALGPVLAVPLTSGGKSIGILNMVKVRGEAPFAGHALQLAENIGTLAVQFIVRARLQDTLFRENVRLKSALRQQQGARPILGTSKAIQEVQQKLAAVAASAATVLLIGETGTGKELAARAIHYLGPRTEKPFIAINCSAIPATLFEAELFGHERGAFTGAAGPSKGKFELANEGSLFLDEIGEIPLDLQPKLLRILEERTFYRLGSGTELTVDVRVIAASSKDLQSAVQEGKFREDLYHRLSVLPIYLPPLRSRPEDIALLAKAFLEEFSLGAQHFKDDALEFLKQMPWRGNVRELRNTVERISIFLQAREISAENLSSLSFEMPSAGPSQLSAMMQQLLRTREGGTDLLEDLERMCVELAMQQAQGNVSQAARILGIDRSALQRRVEKFGTTKGRS